MSTAANDDKPPRGRQRASILRVACGDLIFPKAIEQEVSK